MEQNTVNFNNNQNNDIFGNINNSNNNNNNTNNNNNNNNNNNSNNINNNNQNNNTSNNQNDDNNNNNNNNNNEQEQEDKSVSQALKVKTQNLRVQIRKNDINKLLQEKRKNFQKKQAGFNLENYEKILNQLNNEGVQNIKADDLIDIFTQLEEFDYSDKEFTNYYIKRRDNPNRYKDKDIIQILDDVQQIFQGYHKITEAVYDLYIQLTFSYNISEKLVSKNKFNGFLMMLNNQQQDELKQSSFHILFNITSWQQEDAFLQQQLAKSNVFTFLRQQKIIDVENYNESATLVYNHSFNQIISHKEIEKGLYCINDIFKIIESLSNPGQQNNQSQYETDKQEEAFLDAIVAFDNLTELACLQYKTCYGIFDEVMNLVNRLLSSFTKKMSIPAVSSTITNIFVNMATEVSIGDQFFKDNQSFFFMLYDCNFGLITMFTNIFKQQIHSKIVEICYSFLSEKKNALNDVVNKIARQNGGTKKERSQALEFMEAFGDNALNRDLQQYLQQNTNICDALALCLDRTNDPSLQTQDIERALEIISCLIDLGQYYIDQSQQNNNNNNQNNNNNNNNNSMNNVFLKRFVNLDIGKILEQIFMEENSEGLSARAGNLNSLYFDDLYS